LFKSEEENLNIPCNNVIPIISDERVYQDTESRCTYESNQSNFTYPDNTGSHPATKYLHKKSEPTEVESEGCLFNEESGSINKLEGILHESYNR